MWGFSIVPEYFAKHPVRVEKSLQKQQQKKPNHLHLNCVDKCDCWLLLFIKIHSGLQDMFVSASNRHIIKQAIPYKVLVRKENQVFCIATSSIEQCFHWISSSHFNSPRVNIEREVKNGRWWCLEDSNKSTVLWLVLLDVFAMSEIEGYILW